MYCIKNVVVLNNTIINLIINQEELLYRLNADEVESITEIYSARIPGY